MTTKNGVGSSRDVAEEMTVTGRMKRLLLPFVSGLLLALAFAAFASSASPASLPLSVNSGQHFLPPYGSARDRFGFDSGALSGYDVAQLNAGWYSNWGASFNPAHPDRLAYVQLIRFTAGTDPHDPSQVTVLPNKARIAEIIAAHPGSLWLMSNEPDSYYQGNPILPDVYAVIYHDYHAYIKALDPTAIIANGGIVQPTPCRLEYLDIVLDTYLKTYGEPMPVDVWNIHAFVLREVYADWGASTPPGVDPSCGIDYTVNDAADVGILLDNIKAMRMWMKAHGYQDRPLLITEYGILWPQWYAPQFTPARVSYYMTQTFELFLYASDLEIGYPVDEYRLVQAWAWYSLSDDQHYNGYLFHSDSKMLSLMGETYGAYTAAISEPLHVDLSVGLEDVWPVFSPILSATDASGFLSFTVALTGHVSNLGKLPASNVLVRSRILLQEDDPALFENDASYTVPARYDAVVGLSPLTAALAVSGPHILQVSLDPVGTFDEPREWNNVATATLDMRPDLAPLALAYQPVFSSPSATLTITSVVANQGTWPSPVASATVSLRTWPESVPVATRTLNVSSLPIGAQTNLEIQLTWAALDQDLYSLVLELDGVGRVSEFDKDNNIVEQLVPFSSHVTVVPTASTALTSAGGAVQLVFPPGAVSTPMEIYYTPSWPGAWQTDVKTSAVAFSLAAARESPAAPLAFLRPVTFTWHYGESEVTALDEARLRLFVQGDAGVWHDAACQPYQWEPDQNRVMGSLCRTGYFVFGNRYDLYLPFTVRESRPMSSHREPRALSTSEPGSHTPLLLPKP